MALSQLSHTRCSGLAKPGGGVRGHRLVCRSLEAPGDTLHVDLWGPGASLGREGAAVIWGGSCPPPRGSACLPSRSPHPHPLETETLNQGDVTVAWGLHSATILKLVIVFQQRTCIFILLWELGLIQCVCIKPEGSRLGGLLSSEGWPQLKSGRDRKGVDGDRPST